MLASALTAVSLRYTLQSLFDMLTAPLPGCEATAFTLHFDAHVRFLSIVFHNDLTRHPTSGRTEVTVGVTSRGG